MLPGHTLGCPQDPKENSFPTQKGTHEANLMLSVPNRSEASSVGGPTNRQKGEAIVVRPCPARGAGGTKGDGTDGTFSREDDVTTDGRITDGSRASLSH